MQWNLAKPFDGHICMDLVPILAALRWVSFECTIGPLSGWFQICFQPSKWQWDNDPMIPTDEWCFVCWRLHVFQEPTGSSIFEGSVIQWSGLFSMRYKPFTNSWTSRLVQPKHLRFQDWRLHVSQVGNAWERLGKQLGGERDSGRLRGYQVIN